MPRSVFSLALSHWGLGWLLATLLCVTEMGLTTAIIPYATIDAVMRSGSTHASPTPAVELVKQSATRWEAITPSETDAGSWLPTSTALLPQFSWELADALAWPIWRNRRGEVLPALSRQRQFLVAVLPNAP